MDGLAPVTPAPVIRVYQDSIPWFGDNREKTTLLSIGKVLGNDYFVHPLSDLASGIPSGTAVVLITSNGFGFPSATVSQNAPAAQAALAAFVQDGGILIVDMGDNDFTGGYRAPGALGTPDYIFPNPPADATLAPDARGADGVLGTSDDHPLVRGPDGAAGTSDDLDNGNIDACCFVVHGHLSQGLTLPGGATVLMTSAFDFVEKPVLAEYCFGGGRVILDTLTKELFIHTPFGLGPSRFLTNLLTYALSPDAACTVEVALDVKPTSCPNPLNTKQKGVLPIAILGTADLDVTRIDPSTIRLEGVPPLRWALEDVAAPFEPFKGKSDCGLDCNVSGPDGFPDLTLKLDAQQVSTALGAVADGGCRVVKLTGRLLNGRPIAGEDVVRILKKK